MRAKRNNWLISISLILLVSCRYTGAKEPNKQIQGQVETPEFTTVHDPLPSLADQTSLDFLGSIVLFSKDAKPSQIQALLDSVINIRRSKADWLAYRQAQLTPLQLKLHALEDEQRQLDAASLSPTNRSQAQSLAAEQWLDEQLKQNELDLSEPAKDQASAVFHRYCEAKIWQLALDRRIATIHLQKRPTPLQLCESRYREAGFFNSPDCRAADHEQGKSYFNCLWRDGVFLTSFFRERYRNQFDGAPERREDKLKQWLQDGTLLAGVKGDSAADLTFAALSQDIVTTDALFGIDYIDAFIPDTGTPSSSPTLTLLQASPMMLIAAVEDGADRGHINSTPAALRLLPKNVAEASAGQNLHQNIRALAQRPSDSVSVNDYLFSQPLVAFEPPLQLPVVRQNPAFAFIFQAISPEIRTRKEALAAKQRELQLKLKEAEDRAESLHERFTQTLSAGVTTASTSGLADALWVNAHLQFKRDDDIVHMQLRLDDTETQALRACFELNGKKRACPGQADGYALVHSEEATASYTSGLGGELIVEASSLQNPDAFGFTLRHANATDGNSFSLIEPSQIKNKIIRFELYPSRLEDALTYYSGKFKILNLDGSTAYQGAANLMSP